MVVLILFRKKNLKFGLILAGILVLAISNLYFINYLDSSIEKNYITSITNLATIGSDKSDEDKTDLQSKIVNWSGVLANNSNLSKLDNTISYPGNALVKVREDNKIEFIIKRDTMELSSQAYELFLKYGLDYSEDISYFNASTFYIPLNNLEKLIKESEITPGIAYMEPNFYTQLDFVPNDDHYAEYQWDLPIIGMESAWDYEMGSHDVIVAVVDTGIDYTHPDLNANYVPLGHDWVNNDNDPMDDHFHGTHCAGTIAAVINNEEGIAGMADVSVFGEKAFNSLGFGQNDDSSQAIIHAVDMGADIISCSWGGTTPSQIVEESINYAIDHGVMVIAAAGNSNSDELHYPSAYPGVIAVSATDQNDLKASFSNYGDWVDVAAPGVDIASTVPYEELGYYYGLLSGTSMATPHVSGLAALLMSAFPTYSSSQIEALIYEYALDLGDPGFDPIYGHGRIDATNIFGPDNSPPSYLNLVESADPLTLGDTETISIDVYDPSGVNQVLIEFEDSNHSMSNIGGNTWQCDSWIPPTVGNYPYTIYMEDNLNFWSSVSDSIQVIIDSTPPTYSDLIESADPLILGDTETISIDVYDPSGVNQVLIEFEDSNHSMSNIGGNIWQYDSWIPPAVGNYPYTIYMEDNLNFWSSVSDSIDVIDDNSPPIYSNLVESADPLTLGDIETISIDVYDPSGVNQVLIEYEDSNHSMSNIGGNTWQYDSWIPPAVGNYPYTIYMEDNDYHWNFVSDSIQVITDSTPPTYSDLTEITDPLELGKTAKIGLKVSDPSGINQVKIEFEGTNHSMRIYTGLWWIYDSWTPSSIGNYPYTIYMEDSYNNWNSVSDSIRVIDTIPPKCTLLTNFSGPLELGNSREIQIKVIDISGINQVIIEYEGKSDNLTYLGGEVWQYKYFTPTNTGICEYTIYMEDNNKNWASISNSIEVRDTISPYAPILIEYPKGELSGNITFDWEDGNDASGIVYYRLIIDNESDPLNTPGNIFEIEIANTGSESSYYELDKKLPLGIYYFFLYQIDGAGHQSASATGKFSVVPPIDHQLTALVFWISIIGSIIAIPSIVAAKRIHNGKSKMMINDFEIKNLKGELKELRDKKKRVRKAAEIAVRYGNYTKAAELYEECEDISNQIFKKGNIPEAENTKYYANMKSKAFRAQEQIDSYITFMIDGFLTKYFDSIRIKYYQYPQVYYNSQKALNGYILNDTKFLQHRLTNPKNGLELVRELGLYPDNLSHITALQFVYTSDLSHNSIDDICKKNQNPNIIILIVGIIWPSTFQDQRSFAIPEDINIVNRENIRIINNSLFTDLIGFEGENKEVFSKIFKTNLLNKYQ
jgi:thermitase